MKALIEKKLADVKAAMKEQENSHLYYLTETWKRLTSQKIILEEILKGIKKRFNVFYTLLAVCVFNFMCGFN